jgi:V/A-type H+/Na+-transporting ATPase subunit E
MSLMRIKDGLSAITSEVLEDVRKESEAIIRNAELEAKENLRVGKEEADKAYQSIIDEATKKANEEKRKRASLTDVEIRNRLLQTKEELVETAFEKAVMKLGEFTKTKAYHGFLLELIEKTAKRLGEKKIIIKVNSQDRVWLSQGSLKSISKKLNMDLDLATENENSLGGCIIQTIDEKIFLDNTLDSRLRRLKEELRSKVAKILFSMEAQENAS